MAVNKKTGKQSLSRKEKAARDNTILGFKAQDDRWAKTAKRLLEAYKGRYNNGYSRRTRYTVNTIFSLVNLLLPNLIYTQPYVRMTPKNAKYFKKLPGGRIQQIDNIHATMVREAALNHVYTKIRAIGEQQKAVMDSFFYGFGLTKVGYSFETTSNPDHDYILEDSYFLKHVSPKDFGWHPLATALDDSTFLTHRTLTTKSKLKNNGRYSNLDAIVPEIPQHLKDKCKNLSSLKQSDYVTLYEQHEQEEGMIYTFAGENQILIDKREDGYDFNGPHFSMVRLATDNESFEGIPLLAMVEDQAMALNETLTLIMEHMKKYPAMIFANRGSIDEDDVERIRNGEQGSIHSVNDVEGIKVQNPLGMGQDYFTVAALLQNMIDRILGVPDFQRLAGSSRKSATEASFIQGDANVRRDYYLQNVKTFMLDGITKLGALQAQYQDEAEEIQASGELKTIPIKFDKTDIQGEFAADFDLDSLKISDQNQANNINQALAIFASNEILKPVVLTLDPMKVGTKIFKKMGLNIEEFQTQAIETMVFVPAKEENKIARKGEPMPNPKRGEPHDVHLKDHIADIMEKGPNEEILNHIAGTMMLARKEKEEAMGTMLQTQAPPMTPGMPGETPPEAGAPMGPAQASAAPPPV